MPIAHRGSAWRSARPWLSAMAAVTLMLAALVGPVLAQEHPSRSSEGDGSTRLRDPRLSVRLARPTTTIRFAVTYRDGNGSPPTFVRIVIDGALTAHAADRPVDPVPPRCPVRVHREAPRRAASDRVRGAERRRRHRRGAWRLDPDRRRSSAVRIDHCVGRVGGSAGDGSAAVAPRPAAPRRTAVRPRARPAARPRVARNRSPPARRPSDPCEMTPPTPITDSSRGRAGPAPAGSRMARSTVRPRSASRRLRSPPRPPSPASTAGPVR